MATANIVVTGTVGSSIVNKQTKSRRVVLRQVEGNKRSFSFPIGPLQVQYEGIGIEYVNIDRPGDIALLEGASIKPRTLTFEAVIADPDTSGLSSVESTLALLEAMAQEDSDLVFVYGIRSLPYKLRMTNFSYSSARRDANGNILQAVAQIQLTERPRHVIDPITLAAIRYTPAPAPPAGDGTVKATKSNPPKSPGSSSSSGGGLNVTNPLPQPVVAPGGTHKPY